MPRGHLVSPISLASYLKILGIEYADSPNFTYILILIIKVYFIANNPVLLTRLIKIL